MDSHEEFAKEIVAEMQAASQDRGLKPTEAANVLVQAAMEILETNPPVDHAIRPMWLADSVASIRAALDDRVANVVGAKELFAGSMSPLTLAVIATLARGNNPSGVVDLLREDLARTYDLKWEYLADPDRMRLTASEQVPMESPQGHKEGSA